jgi:hypothetical protein
MNWIELSVGATLGATASFFVTIALQDRLMKYLEYRGNAVVRRFGYARVYEICGSVLLRFLPADMFVAVHGTLDFGGCLARCIGVLLISGPDREIMAVQATLKNQPRMSGDDSTAFLGYVGEIHSVIASFGYLHSEEELSQLAHFSRALSMLARVARSEGVAGCVFNTPQEKATLALAVILALQLRERLESFGRGFSIGSRLGFLKTMKKPIEMGSA